MAASTASTCLRSDGDSVHSQKRDQASSRERGRDMGVTPSRRSTMEKLVIEGGVPLSGTIVAAGNKNAPCRCSPPVSSPRSGRDRSVPRIRDTEAMLALLADLGVSVEWLGDNKVALQAADIASTDVDLDLAERIRASFLSPARCWRFEAMMPPPGGDVIGRRRLDPHLDAFRALGAEVDHDRYIRMRAPTAACGRPTSSWTSRP